MHDRRRASRLRCPSEGPPRAADNHTPACQTGSAHEGAGSPRCRQRRAEGRYWPCEHPHLKHSRGTTIHEGMSTSQRSPLSIPLRRTSYPDAPARLDAPVSGPGVQVAPATRERSSPGCPRVGAGAGAGDRRDGHRLRTGDQGAAAARSRQRSASTTSLVSADAPVDGPCEASPSATERRETFPAVRGRAPAGDLRAPSEGGCPRGLTRAIGGSRPVGDERGQRTRLTWAGGC